MLSIFYWTLLVFAAIGLVFIAPAQLAPLAFLGGAAVLGLGYLVFLLYRRLASGQWESGRHTVRLAGTILVYVAVFWTTMGLFTGVKEQRVFQMRYEPNLQNGVQRGYTFYYVDYDGCFERIDSPELNAYLAKESPDRVQMVVELIRDFGKLRNYSVLGVESIPVNEGWLGLESSEDRNPPWDVFRQEQP